MNPTNTALLNRSKLDRTIYAKPKNKNKNQRKKIITNSEDSIKKLEKDLSEKSPSELQEICDQFKNDDSKDPINNASIQPHKKTHKLLRKKCGFTTPDFIGNKHSEMTRKFLFGETGGQTPDKPKYKQQVKRTGVQRRQSKDISDSEACKTWRKYPGRSSGTGRKINNDSLRFNRLTSNCMFYPNLPPYWFEDFIKHGTDPDDSNKKIKIGTQKWNYYLSSAIPGIKTPNARGEFKGENAKWYEEAYNLAQDGKYEKFKNHMQYLNSQIDYNLDDDIKGADVKMPKITAKGFREEDEDEIPEEELNSYDDDDEEDELPKRTARSPNKYKKRLIPGLDGGIQPIPPFRPKIYRPSDGEIDDILESASRRTTKSPKKSTVRSPKKRISQSSRISYNDELEDIDIPDVSPRSSRRKSLFNETDLTDELDDDYGIEDTRNNIDEFPNVVPPEKTEDFGEPVEEGTCGLNQHQASFDYRDSYENVNKTLRKPLTDQINDLMMQYVDINPLMNTGIPYDWAAKINNGLPPGTTLFVSGKPNQKFVLPTSANTIIINNIDETGLLNSIKAMTYIDPSKQILQKYTNFVKEYNELINGLDDPGVIEKAKELIKQRQFILNETDDTRFANARAEIQKLINPQTMNAPKLIDALNAAETARSNFRTELSKVFDNLDEYIKTTDKTKLLPLSLPV